jgi:uncharacterized membrane protein
MKILSFFNTKENCINAASKLLATLNIAITNTTLENDLYNHPDYPSLLSISDVLTGYGVENISIKSTIDKLGDLPLPCIAPIVDIVNHHNFFTVIESVKGDVIRYFEPQKQRWENISKEIFEKKWPSGIVLLAEAEGAVGEKDYSSKRREEKRLNAAKYAIYLALPILAILACALAFANSGLSAGFPVIFTLLTLLGCIAGGLLIWYELDQYNPVLQQICSAGKKVNCGAVLNSKAAKIAGISWSVIGFTYFSGSLLTLLVLGLVNPSALFFLAWLNVLAIPYVFFSVYYQWKIAKQWCVLCLGIQALLVLQLTTAFTAAWHTGASIADVVTLNNSILIILSFVTPFIIINLLLPAYRSVKESKRNKTELQRLKNNPQIFEALLAKQKTVTESTNGLGIVFGNPEAAYKIIKVCNPYCGPCAKAHTPMEELLHSNPNVQIQILFTATNNENDSKAAPVKHLLAIAENNDEAIIKRALDDWYLADTKDYDSFAAKYPMNGELKQQGDKVEAMREWCDKTKISFTPTFFINGYQLPEMYSVNDLKYFLST